MCNHDLAALSAGHYDESEDESNKSKSIFTPEQLQKLLNHKGEDFSKFDTEGNFRGTYYAEDWVNLSFVEGVQIPMSQIIAVPKLLKMAIEEQQSALKLAGVIDQIQERIVQHKTQMSSGVDANPYGVFQDILEIIHKSKS